MLNKPNLVIITEGDTEKRALPELLRPYFRGLDFEVVFQTLGQSGRQAGGHKDISVLIKDIEMTVKQYKGCYISTFFDYYGLNPKWPGVNEAKAETAVNPVQKVARIENRLSQEIREKVSSDFLWAGHFIPYIQLHEFEALLFALPDAMAIIVDTKGQKEKLANEFKAISAKFDSCEEINDSFDTAPSKRIASLCAYRKGKSSVAHAWQIFNHGKPESVLESVRRACPRFNAWLKKFEELKR